MNATHVRPAASGPAGREIEISVILCAYSAERWADLCRAVQSVRGQTRPPREIVLVVDHNPDLRARAAAAFADVVVVENSEPPGLSGARNAGLAAAGGDVLAFMDEDAAAAPDWLEQLAAGYDRADVLGVGGTIEPQWEEGRPAWFPPEFDWVVGCTYEGLPRTVRPVRNLIGCNMSLRRQVFDGVGGFRTGIGRVGARPVGCEETELCIRALQRWPGGRMMFRPQARVLHRVPAARARWRYFVARCYSEGLSKALVASWVGARDALTSERAHALKVLPRGVARGLADAIRRADPAGLARAGAIAAGLAITALGYLAGQWQLRRVPGRADRARRTRATQSP